MKKYIPLLVVATLLLTLSAFGEVRTWTQAATGKKLEGEFVKMKDDKTAIIRFGTAAPSDVPLTMLSDDDQKFIADQASKMKEEAPKPDDATITPAAPKGKVALPAGETTFVLSGVHMCCSDCEDLAENIVENEDLKFSDKEAIKIVTSKKDDSITVTAPTVEDAKMALRGLKEVGFYGIADNAAFKIPVVKDDPFVSDIMSVSDVHICCGKSERAVKKAVEGVEGVDETTIKEGSSKFKITGKGFKPSAVMEALQAIGYGGRGR